VQLGYVESVSHETIRQKLKKNELQPWKQDCWVIPPEQNAAFVYQMESVLEVYQRRYHTEFPVRCLDEAMKQLVQETGAPVPAQPGQPQRQNFPYERNGTANLFMVCEPIAGRWCKTISILIHRPRSTKPLNRPRPVGFSIAWNFLTPQAWQLVEYGRD